MKDCSFTISGALLCIFEMISPVLSRVIEEREFPKTSFQNLIIQAATFSEHIEREVSETAGGDDISLYVWELL